MSRGHVNYLKVPGLLLLFFYFIIAVNNQITYTFRPFFRLSSRIPAMLSKDDTGRLKELHYPVYRIMDKVNNTPANTNFYFAPCFSDSNNTESWWYLYIRTRYFCYPRKIFVNSPLLYNEDKPEYLKRLTGEAQKYDELEWIKKRNIKYIILFRNDEVSILPIGSKIVL